MGPHEQSAYDVRFDWGPTGAERIGRGAATVVVVDVLSFTTSVTVALDRGTAVAAVRWRDERAADLARELGAELAVGRRERTDEHPWTLSPAHLRAAPAPTRLVLPSPNGATIAASTDGRVVAASLRNAAAVARWLRDRSRPVAVVAAGERWPDGSLRPALEDLLGAGAVLSGLDGSLSPEARAAVEVWRATDDVAGTLRDCASGRELIDAGFAEDVEIAAEVDASVVLPVLRKGLFAPGLG